MNWLDIVVLMLLVGVAALEAARGFGQALLDALLLYGALWLTNMGTPLLAHSLHLSPDPAANRGIAYGALLLIFGGLAIVLALLLHRQTMIDAGMCDRMFGLAAGLAVGMMAAHGFMCIVALNVTGGSHEALIAGSFLGNEMLFFTTYHSLIDALTGAAPIHHNLPA